MRRLLSTIAVIVALGTAGPAAARAIYAPVIGLWQIDGYTVEDAAKQTTKPLGEHPAGYAVYTNSGHVVLFFAGDNRPAAAPGSPADAGKLLATMRAIAGTYDTTGKGKLTIHVEQSWNQSLTGQTQQLDYKVAGRKLTVTFAAKNPANGQDVRVTVTAHRIE